MKHWILITLLLTGSMTSAQSDSTADWRVFQKSEEAKQLTSRRDADKTMSTSQGVGRITIHEDPRITELARKYDRMEHVQKGYRVQIYLGDREGQSKAKKEFQDLYPDYSTYEDYQAPNFKVRVGDFKNRADAERLLYEIRKDFTGAYIVPDEVELHRLP